MEIEGRTFLITGAPLDGRSLVRHVVENQMINGETIRLDGALRMAPR
jgi:hypothetical protein